MLGIAFLMSVFTTGDLQKASGQELELAQQQKIPGWS